MTRSYSDPSYGGRHSVAITKDVGLTTNASLATVAAHQFMYPCKVIDANITYLDAVAGDLGTSTVWTLAKSTDNGTGNTVFCTLGVADPLTTATYAAGETTAATVTATTFSAGDEVLFQIEGTVGELVGNVTVYLECVEVFEQGDS